MNNKHHWQQDIATLMALYKQEIRFHPTTKISEQEKLLRKALIREECAELLQAIDDNNLEKIADGIIDLLVVTIGTGCTYGIDLGPVWDEIHYSNLAKADGPVDAMTGKRLKPAGWEPPNVVRVLKEQLPDEDEKI